MNSEAKRRKGDLMTGEVDCSLIYPWNLKVLNVGVLILAVPMTNPRFSSFTDSRDFQTCTKLYVVCTLLQLMLMRANIYIVLLMCFYAVRDFHLLIHQVYI